jgi:hypothetical protein
MATGRLRQGGRSQEGIAQEVGVRVRRVCPSRPPARRTLQPASTPRQGASVFVCLGTRKYRGEGGSKAGFNIPYSPETHLRRVSAKKIRRVVRALS